jgi:hypothetical protein
MTPEYVLKHTGFNNLETIFELNANDLQSIYVNTQNKFLQELKSNPKPIEDISNVLDIMPELMRHISVLSPLNWALEGFYELFLRPLKISVKAE